MTAVGKRVFSDTIGGAPAETNYDVFKMAGGANVAVVDHFDRPADVNGTIDVKLTSSVDNAMVSAISITPLSGSPTPAFGYADLIADGSARRYDVGRLYS